MDVTNAIRLFEGQSYTMSIAIIGGVIQQIIHLKGKEKIYVHSVSYAMCLENMVVLLMLLILVGSLLENGDFEAGTNRLSVLIVRQKHAHLIRSILFMILSVLSYSLMYILELSTRYI
ncbi:hypothetical protein EV361DRAFT_923894 [Lentinula raphanica]|nr:hypothetical protein EV361DRAFT_923894 [Lentinula raphanica]